MENTVCVWIAKISAKPVLAFTGEATADDSSCPSRLCCDACIDGFGAALEQEQAGGAVRPIVYIDRATLQAERKWAPLGLEASAMVY